MHILLPFNMIPSGFISQTIGINTAYLSRLVFIISTIIVSIIFSCEAAKVEDERTVTTIYGAMHGSRKRIYDGYHQHHHVTEFLGIPYAQPPVGGRRYMPPEPIKPWEGTLNATFYGYACVQPLDDTYEGFHGSEQWNPNVDMNENCLFLNVWTPSPREESARMTVMVWIFGGGFVSGCASIPLYDGSYLAATQGVVVVSMNYRVGSFGFLSFGTQEAPGNMGLLDQTLALQWVQDNIEVFGGNPDDVTIFGESAGAVSVGLHLLSPLSSPLFNRAIFQSGSPVSPWAIVNQTEAKRRAMKFATQLNCTQNKEGTDKTVPEILECLRTRDAQLDILLHEYVVSGVYVFPFVPVVDGTFLTETPSSSLERYNFKTTELLLGVNRNEGSFFMPYYLEAFNKDTDSPINRTMYNQIIQTTMKHLNDFGRSAIAFQYTDWLYPDDVIKLRDATEGYIADFNIICPSHQLAQAYVGAQNKVYVYKFNQRTTNNPWGEWMGVLHGDEIAFVFGKPLDMANGFSVQEKHLSAKMMRLWANFAKTGNPNKGNPNDQDETEGWPCFDEETGQLAYLLDTSTVYNPEAIQWPWAKRCAFWNDYLPQLNTQTANINEAERVWKEQFHMWSTKYMVDWKAEFNHYVYNKDQQCESTPTSSNDTQ